MHVKLNGAELTYYSWLSRKQEKPPRCNGKPRQAGECSRLTAGAAAGKQTSKLQRISVNTFEHYSAVSCSNLFISPFNC